MPLTLIRQGVVILVGTLSSVTEQQRNYQHSVAKHCIWCEILVLFISRFYELNSLFSLNKEISVALPRSNIFSTDSFTLNCGVKFNVKVRGQF